MIEIISLFLGFFSTLLPQALKLWNNKWEIEKEVTLKKLEFDLAKQKLELEAQNLAAQITLADMLGAIREGESLRSHDSSIKPEHWVDVVRALVRPVITAILFGFWLAVKVAMLVHLLVVEKVPFVTAGGMLLDPFTLGLVGAVLGFWFGSRQIERHGNLQLERRR